MRGVGRDSSVTTGTQYRLHGPGIKYRYEAKSFTPVQKFFVSLRTSCTMSTVSLSGMKLPSHVGNHPQLQPSRLKESRAIPLCAFVGSSRVIHLSGGMWNFHSVKINCTKYRCYYGLFTIFFIIQQIRNSNLIAI
jgi:hypothetical protein